MRAGIRLNELEAIHSGERVAEPHLWAVFFKVDGSTFSTVLSQKLDRGTIKQEELEHRGIGSVGLPEPGNSSFCVPGNKAGELKPMRTDERQAVDLGWVTELAGGGILHEHDVAVGCFVVGWELDNERGGGSDANYEAFAANVKQRVLRSVAEAIDSQRAGSGPFRFPIRPGAYLRQLDAYHEQTDRVEGEFDGQDHEVALASKYKGDFGGGVDPDDLLGPLVFAVPGRSAHAGGTMERLWIPTAKSEEGTWTLRFSASLL